MQPYTASLLPLIQSQWGSNNKINITKGVRFWRVSISSFAKFVWKEKKMSVVGLKGEKILNKFLLLHVCSVAAWSTRWVVLENAGNSQSPQSVRQTLILYTGSFQYKTSLLKSHMPPCYTKNGELKGIRSLHPQIPKLQFSPLGAACSTGRPCLAQIRLRSFPLPVVRCSVGSTALKPHSVSAQLPRSSGTASSSILFPSRTHGPEPLYISPPPLSVLRPLRLFLSFIPFSPHTCTAVFSLSLSLLPLIFFLPIFFF